MSHFVFYNFFSITLSCAESNSGASQGHCESEA